MSSSTLLARLPRGAIQARCRRPRPAVCSVVTNHIGPRSPSRGRHMASALVEPIWSKGARPYPADFLGGHDQRGAALAVGGAPDGLGVGRPVLVEGGETVARRYGFGTERE